MPEKAKCGVCLSATRAPACSGGWDRTDHGRLFWRAALNGLIAAPIMVAAILVAARRDEMGEFVAATNQRWLS